MNVADIMVIVELCVDQVIRILTAATLPCANYLGMCVCGSFFCARSLIVCVKRFFF